MVEFLYLIPIGGRIIKLTTVEKTGHYKFYGPFGTKKYIYNRTKIRAIRNRNHTY